jgi:RNA polymerase-interacting CarD/CdnL/TRCF family regulator
MSIEKKKIGEDQNKYFKVEARNSTFFVPVDKADNDRIRPIASRYMLKKAISTLKDQPQQLEPDHTQRKRQISEMLSDCSLVTNAILVRDLRARRNEFGLNDHEENTLEKMTKRLIREWAIAQDIEPEQATVKFETVMNQNRNRS